MLGDGRSPDMQPAPRRRHLDIRALVVREKSAGSLVGDAMLVKAAVEVDTADAVAEDESQGRASRARGRVGTPSARVCNGGPSAGT